MAETEKNDLRVNQLFDVDFAFMFLLSLVGNFWYVVLTRGMAKICLKIYLIHPRVLLS